MAELDPLVVALQNAIDMGRGFDNNHIFYKIILHGLSAMEQDSSNDFEWQKDIVDFTASVESQGGEKTVNLLRGPGKADESYDPRLPWKFTNIPLPSKSSRKRRETPAVKENGVINDHIRNLVNLCTVATPLISTEQVVVTPVCLSRDAMAIKPSGDFDKGSNTIVGLVDPIDIDYVKANPFPEPETIKSNLYSEAGAIIATTLDKKVTLHIANDFLLSKTSGEKVFETVSDVVRVTQTCVDCLRLCNSSIITAQSVKDIGCVSECADCTEAGFCEQCDSVYGSTAAEHSQLRPCKRCVVNGVQCKKLVVLAISMDCESNNQTAMNTMDSDDNPNFHVRLTRSAPDAVHAGKKLYRAVSNWWLRIDGYRVNNIITRCLRTFDATAANLRPLVSDSCLRNKDRMDYGAIIECTDKKVQRAVIANPAYPETIITVFPDPFWKSKSQGLLESVSDICTGITFECT